MANKIITAFFTEGNVPKTGLSPTINIYELDASVPTNNVLVVNAGALVEVGGGWYRYDFGTYDYTLNYTYAVNGGAGVDVQYQVGGNETYQQEIAYQSWEETASLHTTADTTGYLQNQIKADTGQLTTNVSTALAIVQTLLKHAENRTVIDPILKTLTIYDDNKTTPLHVFQLKDEVGNESITSVFERDPI